MSELTKQKLQKESSEQKSKDNITAEGQMQTKHTNTSATAGVLRKAQTAMQKNYITAAQDNIGGLAKEEKQKGNGPQKLSEQKLKVLDADGAVYGRLCSKVAKQLLIGEQIVIVNAEKAIITGNPNQIKKKFMALRQIGNWKKGPLFPRYPDKLMHRCIRGMLPYKKDKGKKALGRLRVYIGCPEEFAGKGEKIGKSIKDIECRFISVGELSKFLGARYE